MWTIGKMALCLTPALAGAVYVALGSYSFHGARRRDRYGHYGIAEERRVKARKRMRKALVCFLAAGVLLLFLASG